MILGRLQIRILPGGRRERYLKVSKDYDQLEADMTRAYKVSMRMLRRMCRICIAYRTIGRMEGNEDYDDYG